MLTVLLDVKSNDFLEREECPVNVKSFDGPQVHRRDTVSSSAVTQDKRGTGFDDDVLR